jgi:hypothetical protein
MRLLLTLAGFAIGLVVPALAQEQNTVDPEVRQEIETIFVKFQDAYNARDAEGIASTMTQEAVEMRSGAGLAIGRQRSLGVFCRISKRI